MFNEIMLAEVVSTAFYTLFGLGLLGLSWFLIEQITPFSLRKEIEDDQNMAVAVLIASLFISLSIIVAAVILS